jgi:hypothetical protein
MRFLLQLKANIRAGGRTGSRPIDKGRNHPNRQVEALFREYDGYDSAEKDSLKRAGR